MFVEQKEVQKGNNNKVSQKDIKDIPNGKYNRNIDKIQSNLHKSDLILVNKIR